MPSSDAEKVIREFFAYAIERRRDGVSDFAAIVEGFKKALQADGGRDSAFSRKILKIIRDFLAADPKYQKSLPVKTSGCRSGVAADIEVDRLPADERQEYGH